MSFLFAFFFWRAFILLRQPTLIRRHVKLNRDSFMCSMLLDKYFTNIWDISNGFVGKKRANIINFNQFDKKKVNTVKHSCID